MLLLSGINNDNKGSRVYMAVYREKESELNCALTVYVNPLDNCMCCWSDRQWELKAKSKGISWHGILRHILRPFGSAVNIALRFSAETRTLTSVIANEPRFVSSVVNGTKRSMYPDLQLLQGRVDRSFQPTRLEVGTRPKFGVCGFH